MCWWIWGYSVCIVGGVNFINASSYFIDMSASQACSPVVKTGVDVLDRVLFCVGSYGVTVAVAVAAFFVLLLLVRRR